MAVSLKHNFVSAVADDPVAQAAGEVLPSDWNAEHDLTVSQKALLGATGAGAVQEVTVGSGLVLNANDLSAVVTSVCGAQTPWVVNQDAAGFTLTNVASVTVCGAVAAGSVSTSGAITSGGLLTANAAAKVNGGLTVSGTTTLAATNITGTLAVCGAVNAGSISVSGGLTVCGTTNLNATNVVGTLAVCGAINAGSISVSGGLTVCGTTNLNATNVVGTLAVCGAVKAKPKARRSVTSKLQRLNAGSGGAPADASSVSEAN